MDLERVQRTDWPDDLPEMVYLDHFGNGIMDLRTGSLSCQVGLRINNYPALRGMTFSSVSPGPVFCYENSDGSLEIAVHQGNALAKLGVRVGDTVTPILKR